MSILFTSIFSGIGLLWDRQFGFLKETLVAPVSAPADHDRQDARRRDGGDPARAADRSSICLVAGFRPATSRRVPMALGFMALIAIVFAALGTAIGSRLQNMQGFQLIMNFLVMPIFFLSGALFPAVQPSRRRWRPSTRIDPLTYGIDGLRGAFIGDRRTSAWRWISPRSRRSARRSWRSEATCSRESKSDPMVRRRSPRVHERVLEAALALFAERGMVGTSMDAIAEASSVSKATIYNHWADKDALCLEALGRLYGLDETPPNFDTGSLREDLVCCSAIVQPLIARPCSSRSCRT